MAKNKIAPPKHLTATEKKTWLQYASSVNLNDRYLYDSLAIYCQLLATIHEATESVKKSLTIQTSTTVKANPAIAIRNQTQTQINRLAKILFSPSKDAGHIEADDLSDFFGEQ